MKNKAYYYYYNHNFINKHLAYEQFSLETSKPVNNIKCLPAVSTNRIQINLNGASHFLGRLDFIACKYHQDISKVLIYYLCSLWTLKIEVPLAFK